MMLCPHCQTPADETVATNCPTCFLPLKASPGAAAVDYNPRPAGQPAAPSPVPAFDPTGQEPRSVQRQEEGGAYTPPPASLPGAVPGLPQTGSPEAASEPGRAALPAPSPVPLATPVAATMPVSAPAALPMGGIGNGAMMSLTGEILQKPMQTASPTGPGARPGGMRPMPGAMRSASMRASEARSGGNSIMAVLLILLALGGGLGGWYWWSHRSDPKQVVQLYLTAAAQEDYATLYKLTDLNEQDLAHYPNATTYANSIKQQKNRLLSSLKILSGGMLGSYIDKGIEAGKDMLRQAKIGEAKVDGETAVVPVALHFSLAGVFDKSVNQDVHLKYVQGVWKVEKGAAPGLQSALNQ